MQQTVTFCIEDKHEIIEDEICTGLPLMCQHYSVEKLCPYFWFGKGFDFLQTCT